jgi:hypothetical protein
MELRFTVSTKFVLALMLVFFGAQAYQGATEPIRPGEAYLYDRFVRPTVHQTLEQELPDGDVVYALLEKRSVGLFHVSPFSVRLPSLFFLIPFLWSAWQLLGKRWPGLLGVALAGVASVKWEWFSTATGLGTALALQAGGLYLAGKYLTRFHRDRAFYLNLSGICLGLSVAARLDAAGSAVAVGLFILLVLLRQKGSPFLWTDRVLVTGVVVAFAFLVLPLSHAHAAAQNPRELNRLQTVRLQAALDALRSSAGSQAIRIGASASIEPIVNFYRAQHRANTWSRAERGLASDSFDYYLLGESDMGYIEQRHLIVLYRDGDFALARKSPAP